MQETYLGKLLLQSEKNLDLGFSKKYAKLYKKAFQEPYVNQD